MDDMLTQWKMDEINNGFLNGEYGHLIAAFISKRNRDSFCEDEGLL
jgi:hypothetical protein